MPGAPITADDLRQILCRVSEKIAVEESYLNSLDAALGDGDHGITMRLGFVAIVGKLDELDPQAGMDSLLREAGMAFMSATGGAIGVILGKMLMAAGQSLRGSPHMGPAEFRNFLAAMEAGIAQAGKAKPGDKTVLDAVHGANVAVAALDEKPGSLAVLVSEAAQASASAARDTANLVCRVGRASRLGERTLGCPDPGAVSFAMILAVMAQWLAEREAAPGTGAAPA